MQTCSAVGVAAMLDHCEDLNGDGVQIYVYDPAADNGKSENLMLTNNFEAELDAWFGNANWAIV